MMASLAILLSGERQTSYSQGDIVCGTVKLTTHTANEPSESLSISFTGIARVQLTRNNTDLVSPSSVHKASQHCLFRQHLVLDRSANFHGPGTLVWPFAFQIPSHPSFESQHESSLADSWIDYQSPWKGTADAESQNIPPSLQHNSTFNCSVRYMLIARLIRSPHMSIQGRHNLAANTEINVSPRAVRSESDQQPDQNPDRLLYCKFSVSHKTTVDIIKSQARRFSRFSSHSPLQHPCCEDGTLRLYVILPKTIDIGSPLPLGLSVSAECSGCQHVRNVKVVEVKRFTLDLLVTTKVRVGTHNDGSRVAHSLCNGAFVLPVTNSSQQAPAAATNNDAATVSLTDLGTAARESLQRHKVVSEFATYNLFRAYSLRFRMAIKFAGKTSSFQQDHVPVEVVHLQQRVVERVESSAGTHSTFQSATTTHTIAEQFSLFTDSSGCEEPPPPYLRSTS